MAQLQSLSINGKDLTSSLTKTAETLVTLENIKEETTALIMRCGNTCMLFCEGKMNKINTIDAWDTLKLFTFPAGYKPVFDFVTTFYCHTDKDNDWLKNWFIRNYNGDLNLVTNGDAYDATSYPEGSGFLFTATYVTADDWPTDPDTVVS